MRELIKQWNKVDLIKIFEILVTKDQEEEWVVFEIELDKTKGVFVSQHVSLTKEQEESGKIDSTETEIDSSFSLDENLQEHFNHCLQRIIDSDIYELKEDSVDE